ncbi:hypothetical protein HAX54_039611, partial [Datura stramonium]|nr:hypothetical protein [Datura stramonium]
MPALGDLGVVGRCFEWVSGLGRSNRGGLVVVGWDFVGDERERRERSDATLGWFQLEMRSGAAVLEKMKTKRGVLGLFGCRFWEKQWWFAGVHVKSREGLGSLPKEMEEGGKMKVKNEIRVWVGWNIKG